MNRGGTVTDLSSRPGDQFGRWCTAASSSAVVGEEETGALVEFGRYPHTARPVRAQVAAQGADRLEGPDGFHPGHGVDGPAPGGARLLDAALLGLLLGLCHQVERDDPRVRRPRPTRRGGRVTPRGVAAVAERLEDLRRTAMNGGGGRPLHQGPERHLVVHARRERGVGAVDVGERGLSLAGLGERVCVGDGEQRLNSQIAASTDAGSRVGLVCGRRDLSARPGSPSCSNRFRQVCSD